jgi:hypothetical protein
MTTLQALQAARVETWMREARAMESEEGGHQDNGPALRKTNKRKREK